MRSAGAAFRTAAAYSVPSFARRRRRLLPACPSPLLLPLPCSFCTSPSSPPLPPAATAAGESSCPPGKAMEGQFEDFRRQLDESVGIRDRIRAVVGDVEAASRLACAALLLVHESLPLSEVLEKVNTQIEVIKGLFGRLAGILKECPGEYYRYHQDWRGETQTVVSVLAFMHWLEKGDLLMHADAEKKLGLDSTEFGLDVEDYLTGLCFMSNDLPRYVLNRVTAGDYDCPRKVLSFINELHASFQMLNLRNDFLRKKFDGMKYDLRRVEEVYYDVKIRGLAPGEEGAQLTQDQAT